LATNLKNFLRKIEKNLEKSEKIDANCRKIGEFLLTDAKMTMEKMISAGSALCETNFALEDAINEMKLANSNVKPVKRQLAALNVTATLQSTNLGAGMPYDFANSVPMLSLDFSDDAVNEEKNVLLDEAKRNGNQQLTISLRRL